MHHQLLAAAHSYNARFNLFRNLIELARFQITEPLPSDVHAVFQELSRVRHLDPFDLTDSRYHITNPLSRTDAMPTALDRRFTKSTSAAIKMSDFQEGGRTFQYTPNKYTPLPDAILEKFPELSGTKISIIDHHRLHQDVLTTYQTHLNNNNNHLNQPNGVSVPLKDNIRKLQLHLHPALQKHLLLLSPNKNHYLLNQHYADVPTTECQDSLNTHLQNLLKQNNVRTLKLLIFGKLKQTSPVKLKNGIKDRTNGSKVSLAKNNHLNHHNNRRQTSQPNLFFKPNTTSILWNHNYFQNIIIQKCQQMNYGDIIQIYS